MSQDPIIYDAQAVHETGTVWGVDFPYPSADFMSDFAWKVYTDAQTILPFFAAYAMRKLNKADGSIILNIRFEDRTTPPVDPSTVVNVRIQHPSV